MASLARAAAGVLLAAAATPMALAQEVVGAPSQGGIGFQPAVTDQMRDVVWLDNFLLVIITGITLFVVALIGWVMFRYRAARNPNPGRFTHNAVIEVLWTAVPIVILVVIGALSLPVLYNQVEIPEDADVTIKATGNQWYWSYYYPDEEIEFDAYMLRRSELEPNGYAEDLYRLAADQAMVVPVDSTVHMLITGGDVIHAWTVPAFGVKIDAMPGRLNEIWFEADRIGIYFGQCSELCGKDHAFMPITVKVLSQEDYQSWLSETKSAQAGVGARVAAAE